MLTRSLPPRPDWHPLTWDAGRWRLVLLPEGDARWCVPGSRRLGLAVVVGRC